MLGGKNRNISFPQRSSHAAPADGAAEFERGLVLSEAPKQRVYVFCV